MVLERLIDYQLLSGPQGEGGKRAGAPRVQIDTLRRGVRSGGLELQRLKSPLVKPHGFFVRGRFRGPIAGAYRVRDRFLGGVRRRRLHEVISEVRDGRIGAPAREPFDDLADTAMEPDAPR